MKGGGESKEGGKEGKWMIGRNVGREKGGKEEGRRKDRKIENIGIGINEWEGRKEG